MEKPNVMPSMILLLRSRDTGGISRRLFLFALVSREPRPVLVPGELCFVPLRPELCAVPPEYRAVRTEFCAVPPEFCALRLEFCAVYPEFSALRPEF